MTLPPVVSDPEGPCPERKIGCDPESVLPHWWGRDYPSAPYICGYCGGRKP